MLAAAIGGALLALLAAVELGHVPVRLPFPPGVEYDYMGDPPPGLLPPRCNASYVVPNNALLAARRVLVDRVIGAETVAVAPDGRLGLVDKWGRIFVATPDGRGGFDLPQEPLAWSSPGRTLGVKFDRDGHLYIANAPLGLLQLVHPGDPEQQRLLLASGRVSDSSPLMAGFPVEFANSMDISQDGTVYFSHSTDVIPYKTEDDSWNVLDSAYVALAKGTPTGMLLAYSPASGATTCLMTGLYFGNGVALAHDESYVLVVDTIRALIHRYWLRGPDEGTSEVFMDSLPGPPDGLSRSEDGQTFWLSIYTKSPPLVSYSQYRLVRLLLGWAPRLMRWLGVPIPKQGLVLRVDGGGRVVGALGDPKGRVVAGVTAATEAGGRLYLGSISGNGVPVVEL